MTNQDQTAIILAPADEMRERATKARDVIKKHLIAFHSILAGWQAGRIIRVIRRGHRDIWMYDEYLVARATRPYHSRRPWRGVRYDRED